MSTARALLQTSHPLPSLAITAMITALVVQAAPHGIGPVAAAPCVLLGELSIGWSNDWCDADRDAAAGRRDKPLVNGDVSRKAVATAAVLGLALSLVLGFAINLATGLVNTVMMAAGWGYNARLKATPWSALAYAAGFGLIPNFAAAAATGSAAAAWQTTVAAVLLGLGGHFANVLADLEKDHATGVQGLPQMIATRYGSGAVRFLALALLLTASAFIASAGTSAALWLGFAAAAVLAAVGLRASGRTPFLAAIGIAAVDVASFVLGGVRLT